MKYIFFLLLLLSLSCRTSSKHTTLQATETTNALTIQTQRIAQAQRDSLYIHQERERTELDTAGRVRIVERIRTITKAGRVDTLYQERIIRDTLYRAISLQGATTHESKPTSSIEGVFRALSWVLGLSVLLVVVIVFLRLLRR